MIMRENNVIVWSEISFLTWSDFKAESNTGAFEDSSSFIKYAHTWTVNSEKLENKIIFFIENIHLSAEFHPLLSWVRNFQDSDDLLKHEQGHFDLAEIVKREYLKELQDTLYDVSFPTRGQNEEQQKQFAKEDSGRLLVNKIEKLEQILFQRRKEYDEQTNFGHNTEIQSQYDEMFKKLR